MELIDNIVTLLGLIGMTFLIYHYLVVSPRKVSDAYMRGWEDGLSNRDFPETHRYED